MNFAKRIKRSLLRHVAYVIEHSAEFAISPKYFRRIRKWPLQLILIILFNMQHEDLADALLQSLPQMSLPSFSSGVILSRRLCAIFSTTCLRISAEWEPKRHTMAIFLWPVMVQISPCPQKSSPLLSTKKPAAKYNITWNI